MFFVFLERSFSWLYDLDHFLFNSLHKTLQSTWLINNLGFIYINNMFSVWFNSDLILNRNPFWQDYGIWVLIEVHECYILVLAWFFWFWFWTETYFDKIRVLLILKKIKICTIKIGIFGNVIILGSLRVVFPFMYITCHGGFRKFMVYLSIEAVKKLDCNTIWTQFFLLVFAFKLCFLDV